MEDEGGVSEDSLEDAAIEEEEESNGKKDIKALRWKYLGRTRRLFFFFRWRSLTGRLSEKGSCASG